MVEVDDLDAVTARLEVIGARSVRSAGPKSGPEFWWENDF
jgi:hypothetical protein